jgi:hypothetical protein
MYLRLSLFAFAICTAAKAAVVIQPDTATASSSFSDLYFSPNNTINGSGLLGAVGSLPAHAPYATTVNPPGGNHWTTSGFYDPDEEWIQWGFSTPQTLNTIYIWNHQSNPPAYHTGYDVGDFTLTFYNSFNQQIGSIYSGTLAFDSNLPQAFDFGLRTFSSVRFDIDSVQSAPYLSSNITGLAEVAFSNVPSRNRVPDDSTSGLMLLFGLISTGLLSRKLRRV